MKVEFLEVRIDCVFKGALMNIKASGSPEDVLNKIKEIDPDVLFRSSFPTYGRGGSRKETKTAEIVTIIIKDYKGQKSYDLVCSTEEEGDQNIKVSKKKLDEFTESVKGHIPDEKKNCVDIPGVIMLSESPIKIKYFEVEGNRYFDSFGG